MNRDHLMGSTAAPALPLGPAVIRFQPGQRVRFVGVYAHNGQRTVDRVVGSGPKADVWFVEGDCAWAKHLEKV